MKRPIMILSVMTECSRLECENSPALIVVDFTTDTNINLCTECAIETIGLNLTLAAIRGADPRGPLQ